MTTRIRAGSGAPWEDHVGYSRVVRVDRQVFVTGTVGLDAAGQPGPEGDAGAQARLAFERIAEALLRVDCTLHDIVRTRIFVTDIAGDWEAIGAAHAEALGAIKPATTMVEVSALIAPWMRVEIEADAIVGSGSRIDSVDGPHVRLAGLNELPPIAALLQSEGLPVPDHHDRPVRYWLAEEDERFLGQVGAESHGPDALLRSLAVRTEARGRGIARQLVSTLLDHLRREDVRRVWLFTIGAAEFFKGLGFEATTRDHVPTTVRRSREFALHHCDEAQVLSLRL